MSEREKTCASEKGAAWTEVTGGRVKEQDGWMDGGEWVDEVSEESDADQQRAGGGGGVDSDLEGKVFWQQPLNWRTPETSSDPSSPARKQSEFHHF